MDGAHRFTEQPQHRSADEGVELQDVEFRLVEAPGYWPSDLVEGRDGSTPRASAAHVPETVSRDGRRRHDRGRAGDAA